MPRSDTRGIAGHLSKSTNFFLRQLLSASTKVTSMEPRQEFQLKIRELQ